MSLEQVLASGRFAVTSELGPPAGADLAPILAKAKHLRGFVDAVNVTDNQSAIVRMSSLMVSAILAREGLEPVMQLTCRDRNRLALQSELLSAGAAGIRNVLCLTGDHQSMGNHPEAKGVFDLDSVQLVWAARELSAGRFMNGEPISSPPDLFVGATANPFAEPFPMRIWNLAKKIHAGAQFIQTQPVFDLGRFERWMDAVRSEGLDQKASILAGVMPVKSAKALVYMRDHVPGMSISPDIVRRMEDAMAPQEEGVAICTETIAAIRAIPGVRGIHLMPVMWESIVPRVVEGSGLAKTAVAGGTP